MTTRTSLIARYKLRLRRKRMLWRAFRARRQLKAVADRTTTVGVEDILLFSTVRNESKRLPWFLKHYRQMGVDHFFIVDNGSEDTTSALLQDQPDVSLWHTNASYKASRFGMDWLTWLQYRFANGHWALTVDADELLIYPGHDTLDLRAVTSGCDRHNQKAIGALMLDLYPKGPPDDHYYNAEQNPIDVIPWFDAWGYQAQRQPKMGNLWLQGGPRARCFFADNPQQAPTMNKIPLVRWKRGYAYVNSTHNLLPSRLNETWQATDQRAVTGVLLHTKFLPGAAAHARREKARGEHFSNSALYDAYYDAVAQNTDLWDSSSTRYTCWQQLVRLGLMSGRR